jgi:MYXO-CTERM domain-containing protein
MFARNFGIVVGFLTFSVLASAMIAPYSDPGLQGTQTWGGNLALTFTVNSSVTVSALGVFNATGTGNITGPIQVAIYNTVTDLQVTPVATFSGSYTPSALGYDVFQSITPVVLGPGSYEVDAVGFGPNDPNGNLNTGSTTGPLLNSDGGKLTFTGAAWDYDTTGLDEPKTCVICQSAPTPQSSQFDAGTFEVSSTSSTPEPGFYGVLGLGLSGLVFVVSRRRRTRLAGRN